MNYHQQFDRLGNQVPAPKPDWQHRTIQIASVVVIVACIVLLLPVGR